MKFGSLFAGIGGFDLGLERAGMECTWQVEIDNYCLKVLEKHWPDVPRYTDVRECGRDNLEPVDLICGGFPCQPHSVAGKRKGAEDDRNLWPEFLRIIREVRPAWVIAENVPGIVSLYLDTVLSDLEGEGYSCWTFNIPACAFDAPHRRERIWIVAYAEHSGLEHVISGNTQRERDPKEADLVRIENVTHPSIEREGRLHIRPGGSQQATVDVDGSSEDVAYATESRSHQRIKQLRKFAKEPKTKPGYSQWTTKPGLGGMADGISPKLDGGGVDGYQELSTMQNIDDATALEERQTGQHVEASEILQQQMLRSLGRIPGESESEKRKENSTKASDSNDLQEMRGRSQSPETSQGQEPEQQRIGKYRSSLSDMPQERTFDRRNLGNIWLEEPDIPRVATGVVNRVHRLRSLGNAVVPQVAEFIGQRILEVEK